MYYLNKNIENLVRIFDQNERKDFLRLDLNENPGGLPEAFINETLAEVTPRMLSQYPETLHFTEVLAAHIGTDIQHLCIVNGSAEGIYRGRRKSGWGSSFLLYVPSLLRNVW